MVKVKSTRLGAFLPSLHLVSHLAICLSVIAFSSCSRERSGNALALLPKAAKTTVVTDTLKITSLTTLLERSNPSTQIMSFFDEGILGTGAGQSLIVAKKNGSSLVFSSAESGEIKLLTGKLGTPVQGTLVISLADGEHWSSDGKTITRQLKDGSTASVKISAGTEAAPAIQVVGFDENRFYATSDNALLIARLEGPTLQLLNFELKEVTTLLKGNTVVGAGSFATDKVWLALSGGRALEAKFDFSDEGKVQVKWKEIDFRLNDATKIERAILWVAPQSTEQNGKPTFTALIAGEGKVSGGNLQEAFVKILFSSDKLHTLEEILKTKFGTDKIKPENPDPSQPVPPAQQPITTQSPNVGPLTPPDPMPNPTQASDVWTVEILPLMQTHCAGNGCHANGLTTTKSAMIGAKGNSTSGVLGRIIQGEMPPSYASPEQRNLSEQNRQKIINWLQDN